MAHTEADESVADQLLDVIAKRHYNVRFALEKPPLMRIEIVQSRRATVSVVWTWHHILIDGWSAHLVLADLVHLIQFNKSWTPAVSADQYVQLMAVDRSHAGDGSEFWTRELSGLLIRWSLPQRRRTGRRERVNDTVSQEAYTKLKRAASEIGVTTNTAVLAAWTLTLARLWRVQEVVIGVAVTTRAPMADGTARVVGNLTRVVPLRISVPNDLAVGQWLGELMHHLF